MEKKTILAFVGMPGAGKSEATSYLKERGAPNIRFGQFTDDKIKELNITLTPDNERSVREKFREEMGMDAYAKMAKPKIRALLENFDFVVLDGLYSWEEYVFLKNEFPSLVLVQIYSEPEERYNRLEHREIRPVSEGKSRERDIAEIEKLNKGGPIAISDYCIINNSDINALHSEINKILDKIGVKI